MISLKISNLFLRNSIKCFLFDHLKKFDFAYCWNLSFNLGLNKLISALSCIQYYSWTQIYHNCPEGVCSYHKIRKSLNYLLGIHNEIYLHQQVLLLLKRLFSHWKGPQRLRLKLFGRQLFKFCQHNLYSRRNNEAFQELLIDQSKLIS